ncbi:sulfotransferase family protein [Thioalkalivibrio sulfidiphilus]|uniref:sulfotransferase family protein n=1 Tax=Thioalkalivibrio sulfidiphilus TaxID=1033854 RepID=UPI0018CAAED1|nr:sulfotransferase family protein [Thioalkalivibrio sulfidiphilus]
MDKKYFYVETPKVACTKIKSILQVISGYSLPSRLNSIHYREHKKDFVRSIVDYLDECEAILSNPSVLKFCFVRNPVSRIVSAYKDKILTSEGKFWDRYRSSIRAFGGLPENGFISLETFVSWVESVPDAERDIHWRSQFALLRPDVINYDMLGKQETFDEDLERILQAIGIMEPRNWVRGRQNESATIYLQKELSSVLPVIYRIYSKDFDAFSY